MKAYRISSEVKIQLDDIWLHIARSSGIESATRVLDGITDLFWRLAQHPYMGRRRDDLSLDLRSFSAGSYLVLYSIGKDEMVLIQYVFHGSRDLVSIFYP